MWCPEYRVWRDWRWYPSDGLPVKFHHEGSRFYVREHSHHPNEKPPQTLVGVMRGTIGEDGESARGTIDARWVWGGTVCEATVRFSAG